jgi:adenylate cyclase
MDRIWQWAWDRYGPRYSWALYAMSLPITLPIYLLWSYLIVAIEGSSHYVEAAAAAVIAVPVLMYITGLPGLGRSRPIEQWAGGHEVDRARALDATYAWTRGTIVRTVTSQAVWAGLSSVVVGAIAGATGSRLVQYGILGAVAGTAMGLTGAHSLTEGAMRPVRAALAGDTGIRHVVERFRARRRVRVRCCGRDAGGRVRSGP